jgi:hypothetical protein
MIVAIHQPQYLPWVPYCAKAAACDVFVYLDTVQFQKNGVQNRNQIKTPQGALWLTVPVNARLDLSIREIRIDNQHWQQKHLRSIQQNYARAPFLGLFSAGLAPILERPWEHLVELNIATTEWLFACLGVSCRRVRASELKAVGAREDLVINICRELGADVYLSGQGAKAYQVEADFRAQGIELRYQQHRGVAYPQCHPQAGFIADLSALDLVLNTGADAAEIMLGGEAVGGVQSRPAGGEGGSL